MAYHLLGYFQVLRREAEDLGRIACYGSDVHAPELFGLDRPANGTHASRPYNIPELARLYAEDPVSLAQPLASDVLFQGMTKVRADKEYVKW